jgi:hypothetical protein
MTLEAKAPAEVLQDQGRGEISSLDTDQSTHRKPKRKPGNSWLEEGRWLYRCGSTVFDAWRWTGKPVAGAQ